MTDLPDEDLDPKVAELVTVIRDRFGLRGLRGARWMVEKEIALAEAAMAELTPAVPLGEPDPTGEPDR